MHELFELADGSGHRLRITYVAVAHVLPGRHVSFLLSGRTSEAILSPREREVMALAAQGQKSSEIAAALSVSPATVETH
jgi:DNA-binding NarL/FixJ family response regulator